MKFVKLFFLNLKNSKCTNVTNLLQRYTNFKFKINRMYKKAARVRYMHTNGIDLGTTVSLLPVSFKRTLLSTKAIKYTHLQIIHSFKFKSNSHRSQHAYKNPNKQKKTHTKVSLLLNGINPIKPKKNQIISSKFNPSKNQATKW